jgi:hypothetical protein
LFPNRNKVAIPHNEYCILGTIYKNIKTAPLAVLQWFDSLGKDSGNKRRECDSLRALTGSGKNTCIDAIKVANGEIKVSAIEPLDYYLAIDHVILMRLFYQHPLIFIFFFVRRFPYPLAAQGARS